MPRALSGTCAALLAALTFAAGAHAEDGDVWITLGDRAAWQAADAFAQAGRGPDFAIELGGPVSVARLRESDLPFLSAALHEARRACGGFMAHLSEEAAFAEAGRASRDEGIRAATIAYTIDNPGVAQALITRLEEINVRNTISSLASFFTRYHNCPSGLDSATWIRDLWAGYAGDREDVTVEFFHHTGYTTMQPSVILTIAGSDPALSSEIVVLGGHQDSIAGSNCATSRSPGADDDASGIASLSEVIRVAMQTGYAPARTLKFMAYAAEEVGLRGSAQIALQHRSQNADVVGVLQLDMTNFKGSVADVYIYTDRTDATQNAFVGQLVDTYLPGITRSTSQCGYGCSDHSSWNGQSYPASFPFEAAFGQHNSQIHKSTDTLAQTGDNANHAIKFAQLAAAYVAETAKGTFPGNVAPSAVAAAGDIAAIPHQSIALLGSSSADPDDFPLPLTYAWEQISGPAVPMTDVDQPVATFRGRRGQTYGFRLTVSDGIASSVDEVVVEVPARPIER